MGLQRAFQIAGARALVSSLWTANDTATTALMAKFYHEFWINKKEPHAALREAQLTGDKRYWKLKNRLGDRSADHRGGTSECSAPSAREAMSLADAGVWESCRSSCLGRSAFLTEMTQCVKGHAGAVCNLIGGREAQRVCGFVANHCALEIHATCATCTTGNGRRLAGFGDRARRQRVGFTD